LIANPYVSLTCYYELPESQIIVDTGISSQELAKVKKELETKKRAYFLDSWIYIPKLEKHNPYHKSPKTKLAYEEELKNIPKSVLDYFNKFSDSTMDSTIYSTSIVPLNHKTENIKHKTEIINQKTENKKKEKSEKKSENKTNHEQELTAWLHEYNTAYNTSFKAIKPLLANFIYWRESYTLDELKTAIYGARRDPYWGKIMNPTLFFRKLDKSKESIDRIGLWLQNQQKAEQRRIDPLEEAIRYFELNHPDRVNRDT
jgi:hypothetical protein